MASKKTKKSKGTTLSLQEFNQMVDDNKVTAGQNVIYAPKMTSWADEVEDDDSFLYTAKEKIYLPSAPRASRGPAIDESEIPREPPFTAHIGNLAYDIGEEDVYKFFRDLDIVDLRLPRDGQNNNRLRGFGYVEFGTRQDLYNALIQNEQMLKGRLVRVNLGTNQNRNDGEGRRGDRGGYSSQDTTSDDWRSEMKTRNDFEPAPMGGFSERLGRRDDGPRERRGYGMDRPPRPDTRDRYRDGGGRQDYDRGYRGSSYDDEGTDDWRSSMRPQQEEFRRPQQYSGPPPMLDRRPPSEERHERPPRSDSPHEPEPPRERKRLVIAPRTVPLPPGTAAPEASTSSIFGGAKPVDTAAREREVEEKLAQLSVQSREPSPPPHREGRERRDTESSRDRRDRSRDEPQYRILQRPSAERTISEDGGDPLLSPTSDYESSSKPGSRRFQTQQLSRSEEKPPRVIQLRSDRERLASTSSLSSRGSNSDMNSQSYSTTTPTATTTAAATTTASTTTTTTSTSSSSASQPPAVNGQRSSRSGGAPLYPVPPAPGASHRHKSDSDEGDHEDDRGSRHERQRGEIPPAPATNPWSRRQVDQQHHHHHSQDVRSQDNYRSRESVGPSDRKTPDSDRNGEKEKDSHSEPEDDRDAQYIGEGDYHGKDHHHHHDDDYRRVERRDYRGDRGGGMDRDRQSDRGGDGYRRDNRGPGSGSGSWGPRRGGDMPPPRPGGGGGGPFQDGRRGGGSGRDDRDRGFSRGDDRGRSYRDDRRDDRRDDFRDRRGSNNMDRDRDGDRDFRGGMNRGMDRGGYDRRGGAPPAAGPRRGGAPPMMDKGPRRMGSRDEYFRDSDGFEFRASGRDRPMPKHMEEKPALVPSKNKFSELDDEQCD